MKFTPNLTRSELKNGLIALALCFVLLPGLLALCLPGFSDARLNFTAYFINAAVIIYLLRGYLLRNAPMALAHPFYTFYCGCLGYVTQLALRELAAFGAFLVDPTFINLNDQAVISQLNVEFGLMVVTTVVLAPIAEECFFRGLLLRGFYDRSPWLAWVLSVGLFAAVHVVGYIGSYTPLHLLLSFIQYLPAGIALGLAYNRGGSIYAPILAHAITNGMAVLSVMR